MSKPHKHRALKREPKEPVKITRINHEMPIKTTLIYVVIAFVFAFTARLYWYYYASTDASYMFNNQIMINTNDGYYYAEGARDLLSGHHEVGDRSAVAEPVAIVTAFLAKMLPFISFETLILFMPAVFGSLIVVPMVLIGRNLDRPVLGFLAAILTTVTYSYYNRTMTGYYDSDMLALPLPMFVLYFLLASIKNRTLIAELGLVASLVFAVWGYPQSFTLMLGIIGLATLYCLVFERERRDIFVLLAICFVAISQLDMAIKLPLVMLLVIGLKYKNDLFDRMFWALLIAGLATFAYFGGFDITVNSFKAYLLKNSLEVNSTFKYYDVVQTVREAGHIDFDVFSQRISGSVVAFFLCLGGLILLYKDKRVFILSLPMVGLGFLAMKAGLRFTVYAVPVMAFGYAYLALFLSRNLNAGMKLAVVSMLMFFSLLPNLGHIYGYKSSTVYTNTEANITAQLGKIASREDYVYTWWDYGYPVRFYADVKNHSDGGKHDGATNYIESMILCANNQRFAANMMREATERYEELIAKKQEQNISTFEYMLQHAKVDKKEYEKYLLALSGLEYKTDKKTRDIYLYLPYQMMEIFPTIKLFSNLNLNTGASKGEKFFNLYENVEDKGDGLYYNGQKLFDKRDMKLYITQAGSIVGKYATSGYDKNKKFQKSEQTLNPNGILNMVYLPNISSVVVADDEMYNSLFVQMFLLENYDKSLFEPVIMSPELKIYKLKI